MRSKGVRWTSWTLWIGLIIGGQVQSPARASVQDAVDRVVRNHPFLGQAVKPLEALPGGYQREH